MQVTHELKCWPEFFGPIVRGEKTFELRKDDRGFHAGDILWLREWCPVRKDYTGSDIKMRVTYLLCGLPWLAKDYVAMALEDHLKIKDAQADILREAARRLRGMTVGQNPDVIGFLNYMAAEVVGDISTANVQIEPTARLLAQVGSNAGLGLDSKGECDAN